MPNTWPADFGETGEALAHLEGRAQSDLNQGVWTSPPGFSSALVESHACMCVRAQSLSHTYLTPCHSCPPPPPGSSVLGISQARILEWVVIPSPGDLPDPGIKPTSPALAGRFFTIKHLESSCMRACSVRERHPGGRTKVELGCLVSFSTG